MLDSSCVSNIGTHRETHAGTFPFKSLWDVAGAVFLAFVGLPSFASPCLLGKWPCLLQLAAPPSLSLGLSDLLLRHSAICASAEPVFTSLKIFLHITLHVFVCVSLYLITQHIPDAQWGSVEWVITNFSKTSLMIFASTEKCLAHGRFTACIWREIRIREQKGRNERKKQRREQEKTRQTEGTSHVGG